MPADGADVVFDAAGFLDSAVRLVRRGGQLVELGWPARNIPKKSDARTVLPRRADSSFARAQTGYVAARDRAGLQRRGPIENDGDASIQYRGRYRSV